MRRRQSTAPLFALDISDEDVVADLVWPHRPPGQWDVPGQSTSHLDALLRAIERGTTAPEGSREPAGPAG